MMPQPPTPSKLTANPPNVALPSAESEEMVTIRRHELKDVRHQVAKMKNPVESAASWAYTWLGATFTFATSLIALDQGTTHLDAWVKPAFIAATIASGILTGFCFWFDRKLRSTHRGRADEVVDRLDAIDSRFRGD